MKNKFMSLAALLIAAVFAFAFKAEPLKFFADQQFILNPGGDPNDPLDYQEFNGTPGEAACPDQDEVCIIDVLDSEVYTEENAPDEDYIGQPIVVTGSSAASLINAALMSGNDPYVEPSTGRAVWQREPAN